ncbi:MAG: hypothetical protein ACOC0D_03720 [Spirochaeta sp.]
MNPAPEIRFAVPSSFLLSGEYFVTEPNEPGLAIAAAPTADIRIEPGKGLTCKTVFAGTERPAADLHEIAAAGSAGAKSHPLVHAVCAVWEEEIGPIEAISAAGGAQILIDTAGFFSPDGSKRGFGSSAAACAGLCAALAWLDPGASRITRPQLAQIAVQAHRRFQHGRGSGYDVMTAVMGGTGFFYGGEKPGWRPAPQIARILPPLWLLNSSSPVSSSRSILGYSGFRRTAPDACRAYRERNRNIHSALMSIGADQLPAGREHLLKLLNESRELGLSLGESIGVPASPSGSLLHRLSPPPLPGERIIKAVGAGNETLIAFGWKETPHPDAIPLKIYSQPVPMPGLTSPHGKPYRTRNSGAIS